ncbi:3-oxoacid CoA-transferase [Pseudonocardia ailaonensis]|uniref:3-oxoacid CoA-transferase n=1 Tax=Pseudonocardia ailaonensis TaxID=367279 RepID=A0ABN2NHA5_9PSEU
MSLGEAVRLVEPGDHVHLAYSEARPNAAVSALVRRFAGLGGHEAGLTVSTGGLVSSQASLVSEGTAKRIIASFVGDNFPTGAPNRLFQTAIDEGRVELEEVTLWTLVARLMAGALGLPSVPVRSLVGSDLARQSWVSEEPGEGGTVLTASALRPDITVVHGVAADRHGNVILSPPYGEAAWGSLAARRGVIAAVEAIVDDDVIRRNQALVGIPSHLVKAVAEVPLGAHPYGLYSPIPEVAGYVEDEEFILEQRRASRELDRYRAWVQEWVHGVADHEAYLGKLGYDRIQRLVGGAGAGVWRVDSAGDPSWPAAPGAEELMVHEAARLIGARLTGGGFEVLMTGIGYANLAAWLAHSRLGEGAVPLMAEIGAYGYEPRPGDPFIFSHRNLPTCTWMTGVTEILGSVMASGNSRSLAVLGAGTIDRHGNTNSSRDADGRFLVGSGGANDIASGAAEVILVVKHGRSRLVEQVPFVTCPGDRVGAIVTTRCVLERRPGGTEFAMTAVLPAPGETLADAVRSAREGIGWEVAVAADVAPFAPVDEAAAAALRAFDPRHSFLPGAAA